MRRRHRRETYGNHGLGFGPGVHSWGHVDACNRERAGRDDRLGCRNGKRTQIRVDDVSRRCASCATAPTPTSKCSVHRSRRQIANWPMRRSRPTSSMPEFLSPRKTWCGSSEGRPRSTMTANSGPISTSTLPTTLPRPRLLPRSPRSCNAPWRCFTPTAHKARLYKHIRETANGGLREVPRTLRLESRDKDRRP